MRPIHPRSWIGNNNISILSFDIKWPIRPRFRIVGECHIITKSSEKHKLYINKKSGQIMTTRLPLPLLDVLLDHVIHEFLNDAVHIVPRALPAGACRPVCSELITAGGTARGSQATNCSPAGQAQRTACATQTTSFKYCLALIPSLPRLAKPVYTHM